MKRLTVNFSGSLSFICWDLRQEVDGENLVVRDSVMYCVYYLSVAYVESLDFNTRNYKIHL